MRFINGKSLLTWPQPGSKNGPHIREVLSQSIETVERRALNEANY